MNPFFHKFKRTTALLLAILSVGSLLIWYTVTRADREMRAELLRQTQWLAQAVNVESVRSLAGTADDLQHPEYLRLKAQLATARTTIPQCRFIYLLDRKLSGAVHFLVDSEDPSSKDYSPPGQIYEEAPAGCHRVFTTQTATTEGPYTDRWGSWVTGLFPLRDPHAMSTDKAHDAKTQIESADNLSLRAGSHKGTDTVLAVLGMDIDASDWNRTLVLAAVPPTLFTLALAAVLLLGTALLARHSQRCGTPPRWLSHLEPAVATTVGLILTGSASWMVHQRETHDRHQAFAQLAASRTESIAVTLQGIYRTELESLARFYESDEEITPGEFQHFTANLAQNPVVQAWEWVPAVPAADQSGFEAQARTAGCKDFAIWQVDAQGRREPATGRQIYYPVMQVAPEAGNTSVLGYDLGSDPLRRVALEAAARSGLTTGTDPVTLVQKAEHQKGVLICRPVFDDGQARHLRGYAIAVLHMETLLHNATSDTSALLELSLLRQDAAPETLATDWDDTNRPHTGISAMRPVFSFGNAFAVTAHAGPTFLRLYPAHATWWTTLTGLTLTAALAVKLHFLLRRRAKLEHLVATRTHELRESESRLRAITDSAYDAIVMMDPHGYITYWNPAAERILGYTGAEAIGQHLHALIVPLRFLDAHHAAFPLFQQSGQGAAVGKTLDLEALRKDGQEISVQLALSTIHLNGAWHAVGILRDITQRKQVEAELLKTKQLAEQANEAKSLFLANMSHEIRTPMNGVIGMAEQLLETPLNSDQRQCVEIVRASGESLLSLINDILDLSKIEAGKLDLESLDFNLATLLDNFAVLLAPQVQEKNLAFHCLIAPDVPLHLNGDPGRLRQILLNLVGNAVKFTPDGNVTVEVNPVSITATASVLRFVVRDTGIGIPAAKQALLFQKFSQVDAFTARQFGGTGLGLAISKQLVQLMDGDIGVSSGVGQGSEFWFTACFAACLHAPTEPAAPTPRLQRRQWHGRRVLLAEDNLINQKVALGLLKPYELHVDVVVTGAQAVDALSTHPYDLVLMDLQMPVMDGLQATRLIRAPQSIALNPRIPIIAMTANAMQGDQQLCLDAGMNDYISKPVTPLTLTTALEKWLPRAPDV